MYDTIMITAVLVLVACSAFFSSTETAVNSCSRPRLQNMLEKEIKGNDKALKFLD